MNDAEDRARKLTELARREADDLGDLGAMLVVNDDVQYQSAADALKQIKARIVELEDKRKDITRPLDAAKKSVMDLFNVPVKRFKAIEASIKGAMAGYLERTENERQAQLEALAEAEPAEARALVVSAADKTAPEASGIQTRTVWEFEITDEDAVPRNFLTVDEKAIRAAVKLNEGRTEIPGVRVFTRTQIVASKRG